ncbi:coiled-coil domain-containing protein 180 isoform X2 [Mixophyes fleayi]|uniref:coiled-coil domain-containing protein 180 isoform X2 n=1 Tax=Mixophyes fleayi TaxID=3061075 RepID=UPI003F4DE11B
MALVGEVHVVPSGKVYRQIFDAEVQLVRSLGQARARVAQRELGLDSGKIPLIRDADTHSAGFLSHRQRHWVDSMPYDGSTENPLAYREKTASALRKIQESEDVIAAREVRGLCDVIVPEKKDSGILQRITSNRQERHHHAVSSLQKELSDISKEMEILVLEVGRVLQEKISKSDAKIDLLFQQCEDKSDNKTFTLILLNQLWDQVVEESSCRKQWIKDTEKTLFQLEEKRANQVADVLKKFTTLLKDICFIMPSDVYRFIHKEAMMINQAILANHRSIAKLSLNLMEAELKREGSQRLRWQDLIKAWKCYQKEIIVQEFRECAKNEMDQMPAAVSSESDLLMDRYRPINDERLQLLCSISDFVPPTCTVTAVTGWHKSLLALNKQIDAVCGQFLHKLHSFQQDVIQRCIMGAEKSKAQLSNMDICPKEEAEIILTKELSPIIEHFQIKYENEQQRFSENLKTVSNQTTRQINMLFKFAKKAVHLWDVLETGLSQQEKILKEKLESCHRKHDAENQTKEGNLDIVLDTLRQESTMEQLRVLMGKAKACLQDIKAGYQKFHNNQVVINESYPAMVLNELSTYSSSVSKFFNCKEVYGQDLPLEIEESDGKDVETVSQAPANTSVGPVPVLRPADSSQDIDSKDELDLGAESADRNILQSPEVETTWNNNGGNAANDPFQQSPDLNHVDHEDNRTFESQRHDVPESHARVQFKMKSLVEEIPASPVLLERFTTSKGNTYTVLLDSKQLKSKPSMESQSATDTVFITEAVVDDESPLNLDVMVLPEELTADLKKKVCLGFYEHLESWFDDTVSNSRAIVLAKEEKLKSELDLSYHLHEPRSRRIETDIHNVRAAELLLHSDRVDRHCEGIKQALNDLKEESASLINEMKTETDNFRSKIRAMESTFLNTNKSEKLVALNDSLPSILDSHVSGVQTAMRSYRQHVEEMLGKLCDTNSDFIKSFRLFSEGGNFSPAEIEVLRKRLHMASTTITLFEGSIMVDLEGLESRCLEQATEVVKKFEDRFLSLTLDKIFLENIQKLLTNLQVKMKALVVTSNSQSQQINCYLEQLQVKTDACACPNMDKEAVTSEDLYAFVKTVMEEVDKRSQYLSCLLEPGPTLSEAPLQGPIATASRADVTSQQENKVSFGSPDNLLSPSRIGKLVLDDAAVSVIKNIMKTQQANGASHQEHEVGKAEQTTVTVSVSNQSLPIVPRPPTQPSSGNKHMRKLVKPTRLDKKYQIFGEKKEESDNFKGILTSILWESNDNLLYLAEEFYKKKERRPIGRPDLLQETFEDCADMLVLKLQSYEEQALEYYNNCLLEFREQLEQVEVLIREVPPLLIETQRREHLEAMQTNIQQARELFTKDLDKWEKTKEELRNLLRPSLGHPDNAQVLENICQQEERRQREETEGIDRNARHLQDCVSESIRRFTASLASLTENMLLKLDEVLTMDDVLPAKTEIPKQKLSSLIRRRHAGRPLEDSEHQSLIERGSRVWPGISLKDSAEAKGEDTTGCLATASITTAKTTLSHVSTLEARDGAYTKFLQDTEMTLTRIREERTQQHLAAERWEEWWSQSVLKIKELYT